MLQPPIDTYVRAVAFAAARRQSSAHIRSTRPQTHTHAHVADSGTYTPIPTRMLESTSEEYESCVHVLKLWQPSHEV